jgi:ketosteroid isomerase-like protein
MPEKLTPEIMRIEVQRFWKMFQDKDVDTIHRFYAPEAMVFSSSGSRPEPGRLASARRQREYFQAQTVVNVKLGTIDVAMLGDQAAVCGYSFDFDATHVATGLENDAEEHLHDGRVTQVFCYDSEGQLRIMHEHISVAHK